MDLRKQLRRNGDFSLSIFYALATTLLCAGATVLILNPIWSQLGLHVPEDPKTKVDFTMPVDGIFYVRNAELGYRWSAEYPQSLWFHPLVAWAIGVLPRSIAANLRLWAISLTASAIALVAVFRYSGPITPISLKPNLLLLIPLLPGGLVIGTGNAEIPCLVFNSLLIVSVILKWNVILPIAWGVLAILTKLNALYMVPALAVYCVAGLTKKDRKLVRNSLAGIISIAIVLVSWVLFVDLNSGQLGTYWQAREVGLVPLSSGPFSFLDTAARVLIFSDQIGERLKYSSALIIPLVDMWILLAIPFEKEEHRVAILASLLGLLFLTFFQNNPNKSIVYITTIPGHFALGMIFIVHCFNKLRQREHFPIWLMAGISFGVYCFMTGVFFVLGTPLAWYY